MKELFDYIKSSDEQYSSGYLLLTPKFYETNTAMDTFMAGFPRGTTFDSLTHHKTAAQYKM